MGSIPLKVKKLVSSVENAAKEEFEDYLALLGRQAMPMGMDDVKTSISEGNFVGPTQLDDVSSPGHLLAHQAMVLGRFPAFALFVVNALMFSTPLEALAETFEADKSIFNMPLLLFVAFMGAIVGVLLPRWKKENLKQQDEQLRQIKADLRRQEKIKSLAPTLRNAPAVGRVPENEVIADPRKHELISHLKSGDDFLMNQDPDKAFVEFVAALELANNLSDRTNMKKAGTGLGWLSVVVSSFFFGLQSSVPPCKCNDNSTKLLNAISRYWKAQNRSEKSDQKGNGRVKILGMQRLIEKILWMQRLIEQSRNVTLSLEMLIWLRFSIRSIVIHYNRRIYLFIYSGSCFPCLLC
ncbi:hypothetical protein RHMOL_Rhmol03G0152600 [Rhododendron molle]|uniref:Uncharacterized protein n=1 Tax=Rhododendron molle TaxID=49168 RepID=A0ACC0PEW7_RHOML|nr:hypothetical protein RHMOL_Rhmol03G0152600 [Rhododendron molle]